MSELAETNPEAEAPEVEDIATDDLDQSEDVETEGDDEAEAEPEPEEETEEVERNGKKYVIPKALKEDLLRQDDYTRKTQEVAELRRTVEAQRMQVEAEDAEIKELSGQTYALKVQLAAFENVDWATLNQQDPGQAQMLFMQQMQLKEALTQSEGQLQTKTSERLRVQQETLAKAMQETGAELARSVPGWGPEKAEKVITFAEKEGGLSRQELGEIADPRFWKLLARLQTLEEGQIKTKVAETQVKKAAVAPVPTVTKGKPSQTGLSDKLSTAEWMNRRNAEAARRGR